MGITKDEIIFHKDFEMLEEYLESMYPNRYEFKENELLIYYPEVTIKNLVGQTYNMYNIFIHYGYNNNIFAFTKLHYTVTDYMNQTHNTFTHPHQSRGTIPFKSQSYCYGKLNIQYSFSNIESVIAVINVVDFWLHNENSSDCYTPIANLFHNEGEDSLASLSFNENLRSELETYMVVDKTIKSTIFGDLVNIEWNTDEAIIGMLRDTVLEKRINCAQNLRNILDTYQNTIINFKDKDYYITVEGFNAERVKTNTKSNINENVAQQLKQMATAITNTSTFLPNLERYYFNC